MEQVTIPRKPTRSSGYSLIVFFLILYVVGVMAATCWVFVLPAKFFYDGEYIRGLLESPQGLNFDPFVNTARVFALLGYSATTPREVVAVSVFTLSFLPALIGFTLGLRNPSYTNLFLLAAWIGVSTIYLGQYSKELIALWFVFFALYWLGFKRPTAWMAILIIAIYGIFFRSYWIIIAGFWMLLLWLSDRPWRFYLKMTFLLCVMALVSAAFYEVFGYHLTEVRDRVNEYRSDSPDAITMIRNYLPSETVLHDLLNWLIAWFFILIPLPVLRFFEAQYLVFFALMATTLYVTLRIRQGLVLQGMHLPPLVERRIRGSITFMLAFTLVQGIFEPDYGSIVKHMTSLLPTLAYVLAFGQWNVRKVR